MPKKKAAEKRPVVAGEFAEKFFSPAPKKTYTHEEAAANRACLHAYLVEVAEAERMELFKAEIEENSPLTQAHHDDMVEEICTLESIIEGKCQDEDKLNSEIEELKAEIEELKKSYCKPSLFIPSGIMKQVINDTVYLSGQKTFEFREAFRAAGFKWHADLKAWEVKGYNVIGGNA